MNFKVCPKKPRSQQFSGFSSELGVANSVVITIASNQALLICVWAEKRDWYTLSAHVPTFLFKIHKLKRM